MKIHTKADRRERIHLRQRKRIMGTSGRPRLSVFRSVSHIYAQVIDDLSGQTLASASSVEPSMKGAMAVGAAIAERSIAKGIKRVVFDRGGFLYHGRIRAVADAARKAGLEF